MFENAFTKETLQKTWEIFQTEFPLAIWETVYVTFLSTLFAFLIGLPIGVLLACGEKKGILPLPKWLYVTLNLIVNVLRSVPFLILMIIVLPLSFVVIGTTVGTEAFVIPLVVAAFPFSARLVESSLRKVDTGVVEAAQSMGASPFKIIVKVLLPESVPSLIEDATLAFTTILGYSAMSGSIGGGGLGKIAYQYGYYRYIVPVMLLAVVFLILIVQILQTLGTHISKKADKRLKRDR